MKTSQPFLFGDDVTYSPVDENGEEMKPKNYKTQTDPARQPKTDLQRAALASMKRMSQFTSRSQHQAFKNLELKAIGASDEHYIWRKWFDNCIEVWRKANAVSVNRSLDNLIKYMGNENAQKEWFGKNRTKILATRKSEGRASLEKLLKSVPKDEKIILKQETRQGEEDDEHI